MYIPISVPVQYRFDTITVVSISEVINRSIFQLIQVFNRSSFSIDAVFQSIRCIFSVKQYFSRCIDRKITGSITR